MEKRRALRVALMIALCAATAVPCSFDDTPAFAFRVRPDAPIEPYVNGRIGIIRPGYARSHLVVAYRYLSGNPPSAAERAGFLGLLQHRLEEVHPIDHGKEWETLRAMHRGVNAGSGPYTWRRTGNYSSFENCTQYAFAKAAEVLRDRSARFGAKSAAVPSWLEAQETVFANCYEGEHVPKPADASLPALIRADRAYQIAAANFYATKYDDARTQFLAIAADRASPWWQTARLVAARALLRKANVLATGEYTDHYVHVKEPMEQAEKDLQAILADPSMAPMHEQARQLLAFAVFRLRPSERLKELATILARGAATADEARRSLDDYTYLLDTVEGEQDDDLTSWIRTFQAGEDATAQWRKTKKTHWLVAALAAKTPSDVEDLLEASSKIKPDNVAYPVIAYHRARLLLATPPPEGAPEARTTPSREAARTELDRVLSLGEDKLPRSGRNLLLEQRRGLARSLADYLRDAEVTPVGLESDQFVETYEHPELAEDVIAVLNEAMPLATLADAATAKGVSDAIRTPILVAAFTRAILLDREDVAARLAPRLIAQQSELEKPYETWRKAKGAQRRYAAADLFAHHAGLQPFAQRNVSTRGWWCYRKTEEPKVVPPFLADAAGEQQELMKLDAGATFILRAYLDLAEAQPKDPRVAEGLSLAIKGTRWSCGDGDTDALAERAFNLLHKRYAATEWAKETPYWYRSGY